MATSYIKETLTVVHLPYGYSLPPEEWVVSLVEVEPDKGRKRQFEIQASLYIVQSGHTAYVPAEGPYVLYDLHQARQRAGEVAATLGAMVRDDTLYWMLTEGLVEVEEGEIRDKCEARNWKRLAVRSDRCSDGEGVKNPRGNTFDGKGETQTRSRSEIQGGSDTTCPILRAKVWHREGGSELLLLIGESS